MPKSLLFGHSLGECACRQLFHKDEEVSIKIGKVFHLADFFDITLLEHAGLALDFSSKQLLTLLNRMQSVLKQQLLNARSLHGFFP